MSKIEMDPKTSAHAMGVLSAIMCDIHGKEIISNEEMESDEGIVRGLMRARFMLIDNLEKVLVMEAVISGDISIDDVNTNLLLTPGGRGWRKGLPISPQPGPIGKLIYDIKILRGKPREEEAP